MMTQVVVTSTQLAGQTAVAAPELIIPPGARVVGVGRRLLLSFLHIISGVVTIGGAVLVALAVPIVILAIGLPIVLLIRLLLAILQLL